jgi:ADP-ribose pyrophosphatase YjhB (NUDIX family)
MITKTCDNCGFTETINDEEATCDGLPKGLGRVFPENWSKIFIGYSVNAVADAYLCPKCSQIMKKYKGSGFKSLLSTASLLFGVRPVLAIDAVVVKDKKSILLIKRKNPPDGWALPGGLVDAGETVEAALVRELREETSLITTEKDIRLFKVLSEPSRDPRFHAVSMIYVVNHFSGEPKAADDATDLGWFTLEQIRENLITAFDHKDIVTSYFL